MKRLSVLLGILLIGSVCYADLQEEPIFLSGKERGYVLGQSKIVDSRGNVENIGFWGDSLLYTMTMPRHDASSIAKILMGELAPAPAATRYLCRWTPKHQTGFQIWKYDSEQLSLDVARVVGTSDTVLCTVDRDGKFEHFALLNATSTAAVRQIPIQGSEGIMFWTAENAPVFAKVENYRAERPVVEVYDDALRRLARVDTGQFDVAGRVFSFGLTEDGQRLLFNSRSRENARLYLELDWKTGKITQMPGPPGLQSSEEYLSCDVVEEENSRKAYIQIEQETVLAKALVASPCSEIEVSAAEDLVAYVSDGILFSRDIKTVEKSALAKLVEARERRRAMIQAKEIASALLMVATEQDDTLPANDGEWREKITPYLRNSEAMARFNYTFPGGSLDQIQNPAEQELGFIPCPGGRAVAYADGHVKFIPDKR